MSPDPKTGLVHEAGTEGRHGAARQGHGTLPQGTTVNL